jgi:diguanylate cyclase (GGDEF)-like protein/PAS domain S-box-containing protein
MYGQMHTRRERGIRTKLSIVVLLAAALAVVPTFIAQFVYESHAHRSAAQRKLETQAALIAAGAADDLAARDFDSARSLLRALSVDSAIQEAVITDPRSAPIVRFAREAGDARGLMTASAPIRFQGREIGTVRLVRESQETDAEIRHYFVFSSIAGIVTLAFAWLLSCRLQRRILKPITDLAGVARRISTEKNYSVRAAKKCDDEIGVLIDSFNEILSQIEAREGDRKTAVQSLKESEERYALAARGANDGLWDWKIAAGEIYYSARWKEMLGYSEHEIGSRPDEWFGRIHTSDRDRVDSEIAAHINGRIPVFTSEYRMRRKDGAYIWMLSRGIAIKDADGRAVRMAGSQTDITEGKIGDALTGLPNRIFLIDKIESAFEVGRFGNVVFGVLFLDLDRFKLVNDSMGHAAGDALLVEVAVRLRSAVSSRDFEDEAAPHATIARLGGDEFAVLLNDLRSEADAQRMAARILKQMSAPVLIHGRQLFLSASIGIAFNSSATTPEDLLRNADTAMYHAKVTGKGRFAVFDDTMRARAAQRVEIESGLRRALESKEMVLFYQPQVSATSGRINGFEALLRWRHPERGLLGPGEFIPIAEECGLILPIGRWVLREACRQVVEWQRRVAMDPPLTVSVNVSPQELREPDFVASVEGALRESGIDPACLRLELTESSIIGNTDEALETLCRLKALNVCLEIDDFGTGYSSLSYLQRLPFDTVKIDRSFIRDIDANGDSAEIVRTILDLTRSLGMTAVAEGVETRAQLHRLAEFGCEQIQGFYFSRPINAQGAIAILRENQPDDRSRPDCPLESEETAEQELVAMSS